MKKYLAGVTSGDLNGIGLEILSKAFSADKSLFENFCLIGNKKSILEYCEKSGIDKSFLNNSNFSSGIDIIDCSDYSEVEFGKITSDSGKSSFEAVLKSIELIKNKVIKGVVTLPICKESWYKAGINYRGHSEVFGDFSTGGKYTMIMYGDFFSVGLVTVHEPVKNISSMLTENELELAINNCLSFGRKIYGDKFRLALCSLNPHCGEGGYIGNEEYILKKVIEKFSAEKSLDKNIHASDTLFYRIYVKKEFDMALCMYHDQGLTPFKMVNFDSGVNVTWGTDFIRTSPDHGVGFDIAGKNLAKIDSFVNSVKVLKKLMHS
ncbi:MAG: 4-hydroxythreonine-4-phosphate dehydrogenase PdxA [Candidatus Muiribacteriota bacterium]